MSEGVHSRALEILVEAIEKPELDRLVFVHSACGGNDALLVEVRALLDAHAHAGEFMANPTNDQIVAAVDAPPTLSGTGLGTQVGPYKLLEVIGEGGFGTVYMAEQTFPVKRKVALKIIKPGLDTKQVIARFEAERQALAMMDHPNIAKVLEAGATEAGRPYFVMELVKGIPITEHCDQQRLSPRQRLDLFVQVCHAVQHAHQKGIIHRDLKPNNVMVTLQDGRPAPKVIDFGIAKATAGQRLTEQTLFTELRQLIGTPLYMSPEQAEMSALMDMDTRSDVYSLGVLLYELLTGTTPFDKQRLGKAAYDEIRRIIREEEPPRPSTRISTLGATLTSVSARRQTDPKKLSQLLRGELDWIVMRAMEKDRTRRYGTASGLAEDVERYLADQPVEACPPSRVYRVRKMVRRNKTAIATAALLCIVLLAATVVSTWQAMRAHRNAAEAERRFEQAHEMNRFLFDFDKHLLSIPGSAGARAALANAALNYLEGLAPQTHDPALLREMELGYLKIGAVQGDASKPNVGDFSGARVSYRRALTIAQAVVDPKVPVTVLNRDLARCYEGLARLLIEAGPNTEALADCQKAVDLLEKVSAAQPDDHDIKRDLYVAIACLADCQRTMGLVNESERSSGQAAAIAERLAANVPVNTSFQYGRALMQRQLADSEAAAGKTTIALARYLRVLEFLKAALVQDNRNTGVMLDFCETTLRVANVEYSMGKFEDAFDKHFFAFRSATATVHLDAYNYGGAIVSARCIFGMAEIQATAKEMIAAHGNYAEAVRILESPSVGPPTATKRRALWYTYLRLGDLCMQEASRASSQAVRKGNLMDARDAYCKGVAVVQAMSHSETLAPTDLEHTKRFDGAITLCDAQILELKAVEAAHRMPEKLPPATMEGPNVYHLLAFNPYGLGSTTRRSAEVFDCTIHCQLRFYYGSADEKASEHFWTENDRGWQENQSKTGWGRSFGIVERIPYGEHAGTVVRAQNDENNELLVPFWPGDWLETRVRGDLTWHRLAQAQVSE